MRLPGLAARSAPSRNRLAWALPYLIPHAWEEDASAAAGPVPLFDSSPKVIWLAVTIYLKYPLLLRNVEDLLHERGIDLCRETVRL